MVRSMSPVLMNDTNATVVNMPKPSKTTPMTKFSFSFWNKSKPVTALNEFLVEVFFFLAILMFISVIICKSNAIF